MKAKLIRSVPLALMLSAIPFIAKGDEPNYMIVVDKDGVSVETPLPEVSRVDFGTFSFSVNTKSGKSEKYDYDKVDRISIGRTSAVSLPQKDARLAVWPGIATTTLNVAGTDAADMLYVYSIGGICELTVTPADGVTAIDVTGLAPGQYILKAGNTSVRFIKK